MAITVRPLRWMPTATTSSGTARASHLADMEYRILTLFVRYPNTFFTANALYQKIWGKDSLGDVRTVQVHIHNLRGKIEPNPAKPMYLKNVWGKGYIFQPDGEKA